MRWWLCLLYLALGHTLDWKTLLDPIQGPTFFKSYWERKYLHLSRRDQKRDNTQDETDCAQIYSEFKLNLTTVAFLIEMQQMRLGLLKTGVWLDKETRHFNTTCTVLKNGMSDRTAEFKKNNINDLYYAYLEGATILCDRVSLFWEPLFPFLLKLQHVFGFPINANIYLTPRFSQGFLNHSDHKDSLILQVSGQKNWQIWTSKLKLPSFKQQCGRNGEQKPETLMKAKLFSEDLFPGDFLYVPRGFIHSAATTALSPSLHITLNAIRNLEWGDYMISVLKYLATSSYSESPDLTPLFEYLPSLIMNLVNELDQDYLRGSLPIMSYNTSSTANLARVRAAVESRWEKLFRKLPVQIPEPARELARTWINEHAEYLPIVSNNVAEIRSWYAGLLDKSMFLNTRILRSLAQACQLSEHETQQNPQEAFHLSESFPQMFNDLSRIFEIKLVADTPLSFETTNERTVVRGRKGVELSFRSNPPLIETIQSLIAQGNNQFVLANLTGVDEFEKICLVTCLIKAKLLNADSEWPLGKPY